MDVTVKYEGTSGENVASYGYFYLKFVSPNYKKIRVENIILEPPSTRNQTIPTYLHVYDKETLEYICSSSNATRALAPPDNTPGIWEFGKRLLLENDKTYLYTFTASSEPSLTSLNQARTKVWPSTAETGAADVDSRISVSTRYPGTESSYYPAISFQGEAVFSRGSVEVGNGYYNADGVNKIIFSNPVKKDLENIGGTKGFKNNVVLTLDNSDVSSFILQGVEAGSPIGYKATKALGKFVYLDNNKDMILGDSPKDGLDLYRYKFNVEGSPTITSEYVTGFSDTDRLTIPDYLLETTTSFEVVVSFSLDSTPTDNNNIIDKIQTNTTTNFRMEVNADSVIRCRLSNTAGSFTYFATLTGTTTLSLNTRYWAKVVYSSSTGYSLQLSTDGVHYTVEASTTNTSLIGKTNTSGLLVGDNSSTGSSFSGKLYLNDFRISVNGNLVWKPSLNSVYLSKGFAYIDETVANLVITEETAYTPQEIVIHTEDFITQGSNKVGYLSLANPTGTTKLIATGMRNPTKEYAGSVVTPADLAKKITLSEDFSTIISVEDI